MIVIAGVLFLGSIAILCVVVYALVKKDNEID